MNKEKAKSKTKRVNSSLKRKTEKVNKVAGYLILFIDVYYCIKLSIKQGQYKTEVNLLNYSINETTKKWIVRKLLNKGYDIELVTYELDGKKIIKSINIYWNL